MKKALAITSIGAICLGLVACGGGSQYTEPAESTVTEAPSEQEISVTSTASVGESFSTGEFEVSLDSTSKELDQNGSEFVTLSFSFINKSETSASFMNNILVEVFQGDISLSATPDTGNMTKQNYASLVDPGEEIQDVTLSFYTRDQSSLKVEVQAVSELGKSEPISIAANMPE